MKDAPIASLLLSFFVDSNEQNTIIRVKRFYCGFILISLLLTWSYVYVLTRKPPGDTCTLHCHYVLRMLFRQQTRDRLDNGPTYLVTASYDSSSKSWARDNRKNRRLYWFQPACNIGNVRFWRQPSAASVELGHLSDYQWLASYLWCSQGLKQCFENCYTSKKEQNGLRWNLSSILTANICN